VKILFLLILSSLYLFASTAFISSDELKSRLNNKNLVILDVTDAKTYKSGHIPHAIRVDASAFRHKVKKYQLMKSSKQIQKIARSLGINNNSYVVIYFHPKRKEILKASYVALSLISNGAKNVSILDGGYDDWLFEFKDDVSHKTPKIKTGNFTAIYNPNILVDLKYVKKSIGKIPMLESRPKRFYMGKAKSAGVKRLGHIPDAMSSFWKDKFHSDETILSKKELKKIYMGVHHLNPKKEVIIYCTGGLEASMNWYILHQDLNFKQVKLYDASMRQWGNRDDTPLVY